MSKPQAIVIGGSAGSLEALSSFLPVLPRDFPLPIMVVVHIPPDKDSVLAELMQNRCLLAVREALDKEPIVPGTIYFAPPDYHLQVETGDYLSLSMDAPQLYSRPSINVLFESASDVYGDALIGIVLSGANHDGAQGLRAVEDGGGLALVQDPDEAQSPTMPEAALNACRAAVRLSACELPEYLKERCRHGA